MLMSFAPSRLATSRPHTDSCITGDTPPPPNLPAAIPIFAPAPQPNSFYPTPPASPDLDISPACLPSIGDIGFAISTGLYTPPADVKDIDCLPSPPLVVPAIRAIPVRQLDSFETDFGDEDSEIEEEDLSDLLENPSDSTDICETKDSPATAQEASEIDPKVSLGQTLRPSTSRSSFGPLPIPLLLNTDHDLPYASTFRLVSPNSLLSSLGGNRILLLDASQSVWDRMPYSAASASASAQGLADHDEETVENLIGGEREENDSGLHLSLRSKKSRGKISPIFVHPPTPEREVPPNGDILTAASIPVNSIAIGGSSSTEIPSLPDEPVASGSTSRSSGSIQVLPEVRSPPRRGVALAADSLMLTRGRNRRPKLFGFTEISDSSSSANSSRQASPERDTTPTPTQKPVIGGTLPTMPTLPLPKPSPPSKLTRANSETALPTIGSPSFLPPRAKRVNGLKLDFAGIIPVVSKDDTRSAIIPSPYSTRLIRKKSGEILKPALKYAGPLGPNGTPLKHSPDEVFIEDSPRPRFESKSLPATPSCPKYVHFDTQLERVKLFLQDQKPQVVSRDGSPTAEYTTSEGEEYPFPSTDEEDGPMRKVLQIKLPNFPTSHPPDAELYLESLFLEDDRRSLKGIIMCKNLSFQKWVAARFTLDFWQTTSEVTAQHKETVRGGTHDRFTFVIKLHDVLSRISEKTLFIALRYHTAGKEIWDSNGGQNYQVLFEKVPAGIATLSPKRANSVIQPGMGKAIGGRTSQWSVTGGKEDDRLADLRAKLNHLTGGDPDNSPPQASPVRNGDHRNMMSFASAVSPSNSPRGMKSDGEFRPELPSAGHGLAARYDFGAALKTTRRHSPSIRNNAELPDVKTGLLSFGGSKSHNGHAATEFYSPRFSPNNLPDTLPAANDLLFSPVTPNSSYLSTPDSVALNSATLPSTGSTASESSPPSDHTPTAELKRTSPSKSPVQSSEVKDVPRHVEHVASARAALASPPQQRPPITKGRSAPAGSILNGTAVANQSPASPPVAKTTISPRWSPTSKADRNLNLASYSSFIEQFCWGGAPVSPSDVPRRASSTSDLQSYFHDQSSSSYPSMHMDGVQDINGSPESLASYHTTFTSLNDARNQSNDSPLSMKSFSSFGTPKSYASIPSHHRSSSFNGTHTEGRSQTRRLPSSPSAQHEETDSLLFNGREMGMGRTPVAC
ncbi:hypothetical protein BD324DRAFT_91720 [Kockovaella imperatae]|uniref:CBM21 domain-containing protein n=1 Tax=Kockovaella imperatae TaxID=4999 RepID=A0A1Y1UBB8_9TREE|nr:hypothetical protein BD324DRAFT_91720 [Kockovaella imperatae]ORX35338.1 hypothetical protein BD324DRAFT_91720 [Kockovaella imperatae]